MLLKAWKRVDNFMLEKKLSFKTASFKFVLSYKFVYIFSIYDKLSCKKPNKQHYIYTLQQW